MTVESIRDLLVERPFRPFAVLMSNGERHEVHDPDRVMLTGWALLVGIGSIQSKVPADFRICSLLEIRQIEPFSAIDSALRP